METYNNWSVWWNTIRNFGRVWVTAEQYDNALEWVKKTVSILYKWKPYEINIGSYNTVILKLLKSNMNLQFVTSVHVILIDLTSYLCNSEHAMTKLMKKTSKEAYGKGIKGKMLSIGKIFLNIFEYFWIFLNIFKYFWIFLNIFSTHEAIKRVLSLAMRHSNIHVLYVTTCPKKNKTRISKSLSILE